MAAAARGLVRNWLTYDLAMRFALVPLLLFAISGLLPGEEGMWTFDNLPVKQMQEKYGFSPTPQWLEHLRLSSVRFNDGGSGSFISPHGLVLTNHHVARTQLQKSSSAEHDYIQNGFYARNEQEEIKSPDLEIDVLVSMANVTDQIKGKVSDIRDNAQQATARRAAIAEIEKASKQKTGLESQVVTLYGGGEYWLYRYKRYTDVRIVFAPEEQAAFFGGDPDNFTYPRYDLDMAIFRVYEDGQPLHSENYLKWNPAGAADGDLVFVSGNPGHTQRNYTLAEYQAFVGHTIPESLAMFKARLAVDQRYAALGTEQAREANSQIFFLQNSIKAYSGTVKYGAAPASVRRKEQEERDFKAKVDADANWKSQFGGAWDAIARAEERYLPRVKIHAAYHFDSRLEQIARELVEYAAEVSKPAGDRLPGYQDAELNSLRFELLSSAPIYPEFEKARLAGSLRFAQEQLGGDDVFVKTALAGENPGTVADELIAHTRVAEVQARKQLLDGGEVAVAKSTDPLIVFERALYPLRRTEVQWERDNVTSVLARANEELGKARFLVYGKSIYPDATFTLRLSYGQVKGYPMNGTIAPPFTTFYGLYNRADGFHRKAPFNIVRRFEAGKDKLALDTPFDFVTSNDVVGGNSGSPVVNRAGDIVGLIFDGNIESLAGDLVYDGEVNRSVAVHTAAMTEALRQLYAAGPLLDEIGASGQSATVTQ